MTDRVLSTGTARQSIQKMQSIVNGPLLEQISALNREGQTLAQPDVWDGNLARKFRGDWPALHRQLTETQRQLEELRRQVAQINQNIMQAGGNS